MARFYLARYRKFVYAIYGVNRERFRVSTGVKIEDKFWKNDTLTKNTPLYAQKMEIMQSVFSEIVRTVTTLKAQGVDPSTRNVHAAFFKKPEILEKSFTMMVTLDNYLEKKVPTLTYNSNRNLRQLRRVMKDYTRDEGYEFDSDTFNKFEFERFVMYLTLKKNHKDNTIAKYTTMLKSFLKSEYPIMRQEFVVYKGFDNDVVYLKEHELLNVIQADVSGLMAKTRDLFVFLALTGMRYSDSQRYNSSWNFDGVFEFRQLKTGGLAMPPAFERVTDIICRYGGKPPIYGKDCAYFNRLLKDLFKELELNRAIQVSEGYGHKRRYSIQPLSEVITSHVARKTFITTMLSKGVPLQDVMKMSGHSDYRAMKPYIAISREHIKSIAGKWTI